MTKRLRALVLIAAVASLGLGACGGSGGAGSDKAAGAAPAAKPDSINVWMMEGDLSDNTVAAINAKFTAQTGVKVKLTLQQWDNINTKLTTALSQNDAPDVVAIGNTNAALYANPNALVDLTPYKDKLTHGQTWLPGLEAPATNDGHIFATPLFGGGKTVVYNKELWADAGITSTPKTFAELTADLDTIKARHAGQKDFSAFYFPGQWWYSGMGFVWDAGGALATQTDGKWTATVDTPKFVEGLKRFKQFQNAYSVEASRNLYNDNPDQQILMGQGKAATIFDSSLARIVKKTPAMKGKLGSFPMPSITADGKSMPITFGGSVLAVPAKSKHHDLAVDYLAITTDPEIQAKDVTGADGWIPVSQQLLDQVTPTIPAEDRGFFEAAKYSNSVPAAPGWATIEEDKSIQNLFGDVATGRKSPEAAAKEFNGHLQDALSAQVG